MPSLLQALSLPSEPHPAVRVMPPVQFGLGAGRFPLGALLPGPLGHTAETYPHHADIGQEDVVLDDLTGLPLHREKAGFDPVGYQEYTQLEWPLREFRLLTRRPEYTAKIGQLLSDKQVLLADTEVFSPDVRWLRRVMPAGHLGMPNAQRTSEGPGAIPYVLLIRSLLEGERIAAARSLVNLALRELPDEPQLQALSDLLAPPRVKTKDTTDVDRRLEYDWLRTNRESYLGRWVALDGYTLLSWAHSLKDLLEQLKALRLERPSLIHRVD